MEEAEPPELEAQAAEEMEIDDDGSGIASTSSKKGAGRRCMMYGCSNTARDGFSIHTMATTKSGPVLRGWVRFVKQHTASFNIANLKYITLCSGHFDRTQYDKSQLHMHRMGLRSYPPRLMSSAVPHLKEAKQPFPADWFWSPSSSVTSPSSSEITHLTQYQDRQEDDRGKKRRLSTYARKKEVERIQEDLEQKQKEEQQEREARRKLETEKAIQFTPLVVARKSQTKRRVKTCGLQVRPRCRAKGTQTEMVLTEPKKGIEMCNVCTQTTLKTAIKEAHFEEEEEEEEEEEVDDEVADPTYEPDNEEAEDEDDVSEAMQPPEDSHAEKKYIVYESKLLELFERCRKCGLACVVQKVHPQSYGSQIKIVAECGNCEESTSWYSQPLLGNGPAGNMMLSASILFAGASPAKVLKVLRHMNVQAISMETFIKHQTDYLQPAVVKVWQREQRALIGAAVREGRKVTIGGDGRSDSPGHTAKYGSYTFMDMCTSKIINLELVQSNEVKNSNAMELEGLRRGLQKLADEGVDVETLITDRHMQVAKWMRETYPNVDHRYDVWHIAKGIKKKIKALAKTKDCEMAGEWKRSIITHLYHCAVSTPDGNPVQITEKFKSSVEHVRNIHSSCEHGEDYPDREWLRGGTKVYEKLAEILLRPRLLKDIGQMSPLQQTSDVESFHSVILHWCPKMLAYSYQGMKCRLYIAALHWNENGKREQATKQDGTPIFKISYPKAKEGGYTVKKVLKACTYSYVDALMGEVMLLVSGGEKLRTQMEELQPKPALCANYENPGKAEAVRMHQAHHRFAEQN